MDKQFPILHDPPLTVGDNRPTHMPWCIFIGHEEQVEKNHDQTLERLAERGGLHPTEMACILEDKDFDKNMTLNEALIIIATHLFKSLAEKIGETTDD
jgi:hypothetical protein